MSTDLASMSIRAPLTLLDKNARKEDRVHASLWQAVDYGSAIAIQLSVFPFIPKLGKYIAKNVFKYTDPKAISGTVKFTNFFIGYFLCTSVLMPFVNSKYLAKVINFISEKTTGKKMMPKKELEAEKRKAEIEVKKKEFKAKLAMKMENFLGKGLYSVITGTANTLQKTMQIAMLPITYPVKLVSKLLANMALSTYSLIKPDKIKDKDKAKETATNVFKKLVYTGLSLIPMVLMAKKFGPAMGKKLEDFMIRENNVKASTMIIRALTGDALAKPLIVLANGAPYLAMRKLIDQGISISILKISKPSIGRLNEFLSNSFKLNGIHSEGLHTLLTTGIQTVFLLNVFLPMLNNQVTGRIFKKIFKDKYKKPENKQPAENQSVQQEAGKVKSDSNIFNTPAVQKTYFEKRTIVRPESNFKMRVNSDNPFNNLENVFEEFENFMNKPS